MAKNRSEEPTNEAAVVETAAETAAAGTAVTGDDRFKKIIHPETGKEVNRKDYIIELWQVKKWSRGQIAKHLTELRSVANGGDGKKVPYQIVFATTKKIPGGPDKPTEAAPVAEAPAAA